MVAQLKTAVQTLNASQVSSNLKALSLLLEPHAKQKELNEILDEAIKELDGLFLQLGAQPTIEKGSKLLPQLGHRLHSQLEQFQLLGKKSIYRPGFPGPRVVEPEWVSPSATRTALVGPPRPVRVVLGAIYKKFHISSF